MRYFYGQGKKRGYFEGWYFKQQNETRTVAFIPAYHIDEAGVATASIQVVTDLGAWRAVFPAERFHAETDRLFIRVGDCMFGEQGMTLSLKTPTLSLHGNLTYEPLHPPRTPAMGPFAHLPLMQCKHQVFSLVHRVHGRLTINGEIVAFDPGLGYLEGDRGSSFPKTYLWTQCAFTGGSYEKDCSIMLSIAHVPFLGASFTGCIACVFDGEREYRLATYNGARVRRWSADEAEIIQGPYTLTVRLLSAEGKRLYAPVRGAMSRFVEESPACRVEYRFCRGETVLLAIISDRAGFEYAQGK